MCGTVVQQEGLSLVTLQGWCGRVSQRVAPGGVLEAGDSVLPPLPFLLWCGCWLAGWVDWWVGGSRCVAEARKVDGWMIDGQVGGWWWTSSVTSHAELLNEGGDALARSSGDGSCRAAQRRLGVKQAAEQEEAIIFGLCFLGWEQWAKG